VIVASSTLPPSFAEAFRDAGVPVVNSFGRHTTSPNVHVVGIDNVECGRMAARTLIDHGYRKLAFLGGPVEATSTQDRLAGFLEVVRATQGVSQTHSFAASYSFEAGFSEMQNCIANGPSEAYFCGDDVLSIGALSAAQAAGLNVPDQLGIIGLNDMEMAGWNNIALTTIHQPIQQIIASSIELVTAMLDDPTRYPEARLFPCHIVERGTLKPMACTAAIDRKPSTAFG